jgi:hypothetical protein
MGVLINTVGWVLSAAILGFAISAVFSAWLKLPRRLFLIPYIILSGIFVILFLRSNTIDLVALTSRNWIWGIIAGIVVGAITIVNVRSQPASREATGGALALDLAWLGLAYGVTDAMLLNVVPVLAVWNGFSQAGWTTSWPGRIGSAILALAASLLVTFTYHVGYREYRNTNVGLVLVGNTLITLAYLLSTNPLGALVSHSVMHFAAVLQGPDTTLQLPPHPEHALGNL